MTDDAEEQGWATAKTLAEALPYIQIYDREVVTIKYGGHAMGEESVAKLFHTELQWEACDIALQLHGGAGYMNEYPIARLWRDARVQRIYGGTSEIMKEVVARSI